MSIDNRVMGIIQNKGLSYRGTLDPLFEDEECDVKDFKIWYLSTNRRGQKNVVHTLFKSLQDVFDSWTAVAKENKIPTYKNLTIKKINRHELIVSYDEKQYEPLFSERDPVYYSCTNHYFTEATGLRQGVLRP